VASSHFILGPAPQVGQRNFNAWLPTNGPDFISGIVKGKRAISLFNFAHLSQCFWFLINFKSRLNRQESAGLSCWRGASFA
jgi:hypothetical protein